MKSAPTLRRARVTESWYSLIIIAQGKDWGGLAMETENDQMKSPSRTLIY